MGKARSSGKRTGTALDPEQVRVETARLRAMLERETGAAMQPITLEADARPVVRAFWETLGWCKLFDELRLVHPALETGVARAKARLADWKAGRLSTLSLSKLPERFRTVEDDGAGVGFLIADETVPGDEPSLLAVTCDDNAVSAVRGSYVQFVASAVVDRVMKRLRTAFIGQIAPESVLGGTPLLPSVAPGLRQIAGALYLHEEPQRSGKRLYYSKLDDVFDWLAHSSFEALELTVPSDKSMGFFQRFSEGLAKMTEAQEIVSGPSERHVLGFMAGERVLLSGKANGACGVLTSGDVDRVYAFLNDLPSVHPMAQDEDIPTGAFNNDGPRPDDAAFDRAVQRLTEIFSHFGAGQRVAIADDLPARPKRVLEAVNGTVGALNLPSLADSEPLILSELERWLAKEPAPNSWLHRARTVAGARALLPRRSRVVLSTLDSDGPALLLTDEDPAADDPVVLSLRPSEERAVIASTRLSATLAGTSIRRIATAAGSATTLLPRERRALDAIQPLVNDFYELANGVFRHVNELWFADVQAYISYVESLDTAVLGAFAPPHTAVARKPKRSAAVLPDALAELGFKVFDVQDRYRAKRRGALGRIDGAVVWVNHLIVTTPRAPLVFCLAEDEPTVSEWLKKCANGSERSPDRWNQR